ncbi:hypothetical protein DYB36_007357 [Aphanomyces astaci]|uniref:Uncharacterized protein n=1 Tax=Aphanomyces astaci TaxID=112090 RepID=A0A397A7T2_APHAT|nr:hypothetical protein DYB36_007357 [Aphanomyces astaci]
MRQTPPILPPRRHSHASILHEADVLHVQNQVLEAKVVELTTELVKTQYELKLERVNYKHLHRKVLGLEAQLENQVLHVAGQAAPTTDVIAMCTEHLTMLHEDLDMYDARCAMYEAGIRELWATYVHPSKPELTKHATPPPIHATNKCDKVREPNDADSDDTASIDSDEYSGGQVEVVEMAYHHQLDELCEALAVSVEAQHKQLAAIKAMEIQLEMDKHQYEEDISTTRCETDGMIGDDLHEVLVNIDR